METREEAMTGVYKDGVLMAVMKRDDLTTKTAVYIVREAKVEEISDMIDPK